MGFEPTVPARGTTVFETAPIDHSGTPPRVLNTPTGGSAQARRVRPYKTRNSVRPEVSASNPSALMHIVSSICMEPQPYS